jgi:predicted RNase H-like HicB family nuclease
MNEQEREHSRLAKLSAYRINATWNLFERFVIDGKNPTEALRLASDAMDVWTPWFQENHIEAPEAPDMPTQVEQASQKISEALKKTLDEIDAKRKSRMGWLRRLFRSAPNTAALPQPETLQPASIQHKKESS